MSVREIAAELATRYQLDVSHQAVWKRLRAADRRAGSLYPSHSPGQPPSLTDPDKRSILREIHLKPFASFRSIASKHDTSDKTVSRLASQEQSYRFVAVEKPFLRPEHR